MNTKTAQILRAAASQGFSLVELLVALAVAAILLTIAVPSFAGYIANVRATTAANDLLRDLNMARSQALNTGIAANVTASGSSLSGGWQVNSAQFDGDGDTEFTPVIARDALAAQIHIDTCIGNTLVTTPIISFNRLGALSGTGAITIHIQTGEGDAKTERVVAVGLNGRAEVRNHNSSGTFVCPSA